MLHDLSTLAVELIVLGAGKLLRGLGGIGPLHWADGSAGKTHARGGAGQSTLGEHCSFVAGGRVERGSNWAVLREVERLRDDLRASTFELDESEHQVRWSLGTFARFD